MSRLGRARDRCEGKLWLVWWSLRCLWAARKGGTEGELVEKAGPTRTTPTLLSLATNHDLHTLTQSPSTTLHSPPTPTPSY